MKNVIILFIILSHFILSNCNKNKGDNLISGISIAYKNKNSDDLLDTAIQGHFSADSIKVYNLVKGIKKEVDYPNLDHPHNFFIYKSDSLKEYLLGVIFETDTTFLQLNQGNIDAITCIFDNSYGNKILRQLSYNYVLKWEEGLNRDYVITIVK